ncbi:MAG: OB-fold putative lipoprotein [Deltaproteobacteria bacterium]|jgi:hypothetical protein|nr:OB-fold putative lipoprotein [Deltaproteobacteria bacterium]
MSNFMPAPGKPLVGKFFWISLGVTAAVIISLLAIYHFRERAKLAEREKSSQEINRLREETNDFIDSLAGLKRPMSVQYLTGEYERNEYAADQKYKGKIIGIYGLVDRVKTSVGGRPEVYIKDENTTDLALVEFTDEAGEILVHAEKGDPIAVLCVGSVYIGVPSAIGCILNADWPLPGHR